MTAARDDDENGSVAQIDKRELSTALMKLYRKIEMEIDVKTKNSTATAVVANPHRHRQHQNQSKYSI